MRALLVATAALFALAGCETTNIGVIDELTDNVVVTEGQSNCREVYTKSGNYEVCD